MIHSRLVSRVRLGEGLTPDPRAQQLDYDGHSTGRASKPGSAGQRVSGRFSTEDGLDESVSVNRIRHRLAHQFVIPRFNLRHHPQKHDFCGVKV